jgi:signal transduction histidine kinase
MDPILIVDDEKDNLEALKRMLRGQYDVTIAESPIEAMKLVQSHLFHVIISDQRMPQMTGVEFLEKAKKLSPLSTRILLTGYTDIESVIDSINRGQIYRYVSKPWEPEDLRMTLRQANEAFLLKKELEDKNQRLEKAVAELTVLDKAKARFLSLVSHELNTPLTVLNSFIELISDSKKELSSDFEKSISLIKGASDRLNEIVKDVVEYVRLESNPILNKQQSDLKEILVGVLSDLSEKAKLKNVKQQLNLTESGLVMIDKEQIHTALQRLAQDTLKRAPRDSAVDWFLRVNSEKVEVEVSRSGDPISESALNAFETGQSQMHHHQNLAMDLAFCRTIVERHLGVIKVQKNGDLNRILIEIPR